MNLVYRLDWVLYVMVLFGGMVVALSVGVYLLKRRSRHQYGNRVTFNRVLTRSAIGGEHEALQKALRRKPLEVLNEIALYGSHIRISATLRRVIRDSFGRTAGPRVLMRYLRSRRIERRLFAMRLIRLYPSDELLDRLIETIRTERSIYAAYAGWYSFFTLDDSRALHLLVESEVFRESAIFRWALRTLENAGPRVRDAARGLLDSEDTAMQRALLHLGVADGSGSLGHYLQRSLDSDDQELRDEACDILRRRRPKRVDRPDLLTGGGAACQTAALEAHFSLSRTIDYELLDALLADPVTRDKSEARAAELLRRSPGELEGFVDRFLTLEPGERADSYVRVLRSRLPFLLNHYLEEQPETASALLAGWVRNGQYAGIVDFLNRNRVAGIETRLLAMLQPLVGDSPEFAAYCARYLDDRLRETLHLPGDHSSPGSSRIPLTRRDKFYLLALMIAAVALFPALFVVRNIDTLSGMNAGYILRSFLIDYNYLFAAYAIALNGSYLILLFLSSRELQMQSILWAIRDERFLFDGAMLPGMTILAPAYNEEKSVVESVRSLLALRYPNYQVIVVNDGSTDRTLEGLLEAFEMERVDAVEGQAISTAPIRGLYRNPQIPNLLVVDKENGGKADALNAGINYSETEYICSIDSDSLLERDSLLAMAYPITLEDREVVAVGGNILPVNGCTVVDGEIRAIHPPENRIALYQTIEYLRSFIAARVGWASLNSLVIISGAFGVFNRARVLEIGGYMTGTGIFKKDTVGEDMELVVRLVKHMNKHDAPFAIKYAHNANCWTEVPEDRHSLLRQRDRWQRGLIEIMSYHKSMIFNRRYRGAGLLTFPYLLIFELLGPFWEFLGYIVVFLSLLFGLLSLKVLMLLFSASILLGVVVSMGSLYLSEKGVLFFKGKDFFRVLSVAILENFGYRQVLSWYRAYSYASFLLKNKGWQHLTRRGFQGENANTTADGTI